MKLIANELAWIVQHPRYIPAWPPSEHRALIAVIYAESAGDSEAIGYNEPLPPPTPLTPTWGSADLGLCQINNHWHARSKIIKLGLNWRDPYDNIHMGYLCWIENGGFIKPDPTLKHGWTAWTTWRTDDPQRSYKRFLPRADIGLRDPFPPGQWP